ncbi:MAG: hypothetical protein JWP72_1582 [Massilia sp.]|nr:hypothetical protein [Massilia sp.]MDB5793186.1 hypothetical protein [Massilia sp.]
MDFFCKVTAFMTPGTFRLLIILQTVSVLAATLAGLFFSDDAFSLRLRSAYDAESTPLAALPPWLLLSMGAALFIATAATTIGMWLFRRWARTLSLWLSVLLLPLTLLAGPILEAPFESMFNDLSMVLFGAMMAVAYFSPLSARFEARAPR